MFIAGTLTWKMFQNGNTNRTIQWLQDLNDIFFKPTNSLWYAFHIHNNEYIGVMLSF